MGHVWEWQLSFPITEITPIPSLPPQQAHPDPVGAAGSLLTTSRLQAPIPPAPSPQEQWENAHLKLPMVTQFTGVKAVLPGGINPFQTCPPDGFHRSSISLNSNKKEIYSLCTSQYCFGEMKHCACQQCFPFKFLMPFSKGERRWFQARRRLAERTS